MLLTVSRVPLGFADIAAAAFILCKEPLLAILGCPRGSMDAKACGLWCFVALFTLAPAQGFAEGIENAEESIEAKQWTAALETLLGLQDKAKEEAELEQLATKLEEVGAALRGLAQFEAALRAGQGLLVMRRRIHGDGDDPRVGEGLDRVAFCLDSLGRFEEALSYRRACLEMFMRLAGNRDRHEVCVGLSNLGQCLMRSGRADEALPHLEASLAMAERLHHGDDDDAVSLAMVHANLAVCLRALGRAKDGLTHDEAALGMFRRLSGDDDHPNVATCLEVVS